MSHVHFRPGHLAPAILARQSRRDGARNGAGLSPGGVCQRDLDRYYALLQTELATIELSEAEAALVVEACTGTTFDANSIRLLWAQVYDAIWPVSPDSKWGVEGPELVTKLRRLTPAQAHALVDAVERYWAAVGSGDATPIWESLHQVGLV